MNEQFEQINNIGAAIEAILYAAGYPVKYEKLSEVLGLSKKDIKSIVHYVLNRLLTLYLLLFKGIYAPVKYNIGGTLSPSLRSPLSI